MNSTIVTLLILGFVFLSLALLLLSVRLFFRKEVAIESGCCKTQDRSGGMNTSAEIHTDQGFSNCGPACCQRM